MLLATQVEPQMIEHAHPNLGRLIQPRHHNALATTTARGVPWSANNDCYQGLDPRAYDAMTVCITSAAGACSSPSPTW